MRNNLSSHQAKLLEKYRGNWRRSSLGMFCMIHIEQTLKLLWPARSYRRNDFVSRTHIQETEAALRKINKPTRSGPRKADAWQNLPVASTAFTPFLKEPSVLARQVVSCSQVYLAGKGFSFICGATVGSPLKKEEIPQTSTMWFCFLIDLSGTRTGISFWIHFSSLLPHGIYYPIV